MREIAVVSGKGGTGKTSFVAAFAELSSKPVVLCDCDVDASDLALLMPGPDSAGEPFYAGQRARIDEERCFYCGDCADVCRYGALTLEHGAVPVVDDFSCEGCRACSVVCPEQAISFADNRCGTVYLRETGAGPLVHAALGIAEDNSGKLVAEVRERTRALAEQRGLDTIWVDGPPGIGCPVHAALSGADLVIAVTEPTPSGEHDLRRLLDLCAHFKLQAVVIINKFDLNERSAGEVERLVAKRGAKLLGRVPFHRDVPAALARGLSPLAVPEVRQALAKIWSNLAGSGVGRQLYRRALPRKGRR